MGRRPAPQAPSEWGWLRCPVWQRELEEQSSLSASATFEEANGDTMEVTGDMNGAFKRCQGCADRHVEAGVLVHSRQLRLSEGL